MKKRILFYSFPLRFLLSVAQFCCNVLFFLRKSRDAAFPFCGYTLVPVFVYVRRISKFSESRLFYFHEKPRLNLFFLLLYFILYFILYFALYFVLYFVLYFPFLGKSLILDNIILHVYNECSF